MLNLFWSCQDPALAELCPAQPQLDVSLKLNLRFREQNDWIVNTPGLNEFDLKDTPFRLSLVSA